MKSPYTLYENSSILRADIEMPELPATITFEEQELFVKDEFHITLVSARYLANIINSANPDAIVQQIVDEFDEFTETTPLEDYTLSDELRFVQTDKERTIVRMAEVPGLHAFFQRLTQTFALDLPEQQTHVTLYRYPENYIGIAIPSTEILQTTSRLVEMPELGERFKGLHEA